MSKKPELEHKWFFPGNKQAWLLICCNFLLYLVKTAITYLFHGPPQHRCYSVCPFSERRAGCVCVRAHARVHVLQSNLSQVFPLHAVLFAAFYVTLLPVRHQPQTMVC